VERLAHNQMVAGSNADLPHGAGMYENPVGPIFPFSGNFGDNASFSPFIEMRGDFCGEEKELLKNNSGNHFPQRALQCIRKKMYWGDLHLPLYR